MNHPQIHLYELIQSLSPGEKGYVRSSMKKKGDVTGIYLELFDTIVKTLKVDKDRELGDIDNLLKVHGVKQLSQKKNYLFRLILRFISQYHVGKSPGQKLFELINCGELLYHREIWSAAWKIVQKARKSLYSEKLYEYGPLLLKLEGKIIRSAPSHLKTKWIISSQEDLLREEDKILSHLRVRNKLKDIFFQSNNILDDDYCITTPIEKQEQEAIELNNKLETALETQTDFFANQDILLIEAIRTNIAYCSGISKRKTQKHIERLLMIAEARGTGDKKYRQTQIFWFQMILESFQKQLTISLSDIYSKITKNLNSIKLQSSLFTLVLSYRIEFCILEKNPEEGYQTVQTLTDFINRKKSKIDEKTLFNSWKPIYQFYFAFGDFRHVLDTINLILNSKFGVQSKLALICYEIAFSIAHFELGNLLFLSDYITKLLSSYRNMEISPQNEIKMLLGLMELTKAESKSEQNAIFQRLLSSICWDYYTFGRNVISKSVFKGWLISRSTGKPLLESCVPLIGAT